MIKETICSLKGQFFVSPREEIFIEFLKSELNIPEEIIEEGIRECLNSVPPEKRRKYPISKCYGKVMEVFKNYLREKAKRNHINWKEEFQKKISLVKSFIDFEVIEPKSESEAEEILNEIEKKIIKKLWDGMEDKEKRQLISKYKDIKRESKELFKELIKEEVRKKFGIPVLSIYVK